MPKILLHVCCGPCGIYPIMALKKQYAVTAFYYNPNIHPKEEYKRRLKAFEDHCRLNNINYLIAEYKPEEYFSKIKGREKEKEKRCPLCYELRLEETAKKAKENNCQAFTSTLLISPQQDINLVRDLGKSLGDKYGLKFFDNQPEGGKKKYKGFRPGFTEGRKIAKAENLYAQDYCGCIFSQRGL